MKIDNIDFKINLIIFILKVIIFYKIKNLNNSNKIKKIINNNKYCKDNNKYNKI